jgi:replication initiation protein RepC
MMETESAFGAPGESFAGAPTGFRRLTPGLLAADRTAEDFDGLPEGVEVHGQLLAAFKAAASRLGLAPRLVHAIDWLFKFTQPQDWEEGWRPIVWPSASLQQEALGLSPTQAKAINRALIEAGLITMKDSPNGKRYGIRNRKGQIVEAYGFDLSPIAARYEEFVSLAEEAKAERAELGRLRRRATIARKGITQILETAAEYDCTGEEWPTLMRETRGLTLALRRAERPAEVAFGVEGLERRQDLARKRLESLLLEAESVSSESVDSNPKGSEYRPHSLPTNPTIDPEQDTVIAHQGCKSVSGVVPSDIAPAGTPGGPERAAVRPGDQGNDGKVAEPAPAAGQGDQQRPPPPGRTDSNPVMKLPIDELLRLAPRLRTYLTSPRPAWPEIVNAADWLRGELGVSQSLWGEACLAMGREQATIAIAIVSAKPAAHFRSTPGGYFHGMVVKAKSGQLNLGRTVWGLRQTAAAKSRRGSSPPVPS